jgi:lipopolysaccharide/colanic/teichoic acid biosynthesis glycosyltransferase
VAVSDEGATSLGQLTVDPGLLTDFDRVIVASPTIDEASLLRLVSACRRNHIKMSLVPPLRGIFGTPAQLSRVADLPVIEYACWDLSRSTLVLKRLLDVSVSAVSLIFLAPLFAVVAVFIKLDSKGAVFFTQQRSGLNGRPFRMLKFRTMVVNAESLLEELISFDELPTPMFKLENDPRVTRFGRLLRRTTIDELPKLINVLRGEMSLVGPRPEQIELVARYGDEHPSGLTSSLASRDRCRSTAAGTSRSRSDSRSSASTSRTSRSRATSGYLH